jgi:adenosylcobinamide-phosphate synthase
MLSLAVPLALLIDLAIGWPSALYRRIGHPVGAFAALLNACDHRWNMAPHSFVRRRWAGMLTLLLLLGLTLGVCTALVWLADHLLGPWAFLALAFLAWPALAQHSLYVHGKAVADALDHGGLDAGRRAVGQICGRDVSVLDEHGVARAAIESLSESLSDGIIAPLFWFLIGGLPMLWAYKAINTADSMIGHKDTSYAAFGWASARLDDLVNIIPARLSALLICLSQRHVRRSLSITWRYHAHHASPNSGWPEAAMAGALNLRLAGPLQYDGEAYSKPWIGDGRTNATSADIRHALIIIRRCYALSWLITIVIIGGLFLWQP